MPSLRRSITSSKKDYSIHDMTRDGEISPVPSFQRGGLLLTRLRRSPWPTKVEPLAFLRPRVGRFGLADQKPKEKSSPPMNHAPRDTVLTNPSMDRGAADAEGTGRCRTIASRGAQRLLDELAVELTKRFPTRMDSRRQGRDRSRSPWLAGGQLVLPVPVN